MANGLKCIPATPKQPTRCGEMAGIAPTGEIAEIVQVQRIITLVRTTDCLLKGIEDKHNLPVALALPAYSFVWFMV